MIDILERLGKWLDYRVGGSPAPVNHWGGVLHQDLADAIAVIKELRARRDSLLRSNNEFEQQARDARREANLMTGTMEVWRQMYQDLRRDADVPPVPRPLDEWHEDMGDQVWWCFNDGAWLGEAPYIGSPTDLGFDVIIQPSVTLHIATGEAAEKADPSSDDLTMKPHKFSVGGWPGYHTHFTPIGPFPKVPR